MGLELLPPSPVPPMADITSSFWCPAEPKCHLRNLPRASLLIEVGSRDKPTHLFCMNPFLSFLQVRTLRARQGSDVPRGAHCGWQQTQGSEIQVPLSHPSAPPVGPSPPCEGTQSCRNCLLKPVWLCLAYWGSVRTSLPRAG